MWSGLTLFSSKEQRRWNKVQYYKFWVFILLFFSLSLSLSHYITNEGHLSLNNNQDKDRNMYLFKWSQCLSTRDGSRWVHAALTWQGFTWSMIDTSCPLFLCIYSQYLHTTNLIKWPALIYDHLSQPPNFSFSIMWNPVKWPTHYVTTFYAQFHTWRKLHKRVSTAVWYLTVSSCWACCYIKVWLKSCHYSRWEWPQSRLGWCSSHHWMKPCPPTHCRKWNLPDQASRHLEPNKCNAAPLTWGSQDQK